MTDPLNQFSTTHTAWMVPVFKLRQKYRILLDTYIDLNKIYATPPIKIKAMAKKVKSDRLLIFKTSQAVPDAVISYSADGQD